MKFNNEFYNQIKGAAMGTIFAPTYATLLMGYFEIKLYSVWTFNYGELLVEYIKENWKRFLDDCYTVLRSSQLVLKSYYSLITQLILQCSSLRNIVRTTFHFQIIKRNKNGIWMDLYNQPTDTQRCLSFTSSHPSHCKHNIPFFQREEFILLQKIMPRSLRIWKT